MIAVLVAVQVTGLQRDDTRAGVIVGQVIDADSSRPVAGAVVSMGGPPGPGSTPRQPLLTGSDGRFAFREMARGNYTITVNKGGFVAGAYGQTRPGGQTLPLTMADGERRDDIVIRLWRHAAITGTVVDESGERQVGVQVRAYRRAVVAGRRRFVPSGSALTDDRGIYRISTLLPGDYIVGTAPRQTSVPLSLTRDVQPGSAEGQVAAELAGSGAPLVVRDAVYMLGRGAATPAAPEGGRFAVYPPAFHPYAPAGDPASVISLQPGQEHDGADIRLTPVATVGVSGSVIGPDGPVTVAPLRLVPAATLEMPMATDGLTAITDRRGAFSFAAVPSGHYLLQLSRGRVSFSPVTPGASREDRSVIWVDLPLSVGTEDIESMVVQAQPGLRVGGRVEFEGDPARALGSLPGIRIAIEPVDIPPGTPVPPFIARPDRFGEFTSPGLPGGRYYVRIPNSPAGWMFKSATLEGRDVADTPITLTADAPNVVITFTDRWSGLNGRVHSVRASAGDTTVIVFPGDTDMWGSSGLMPRRLRSARATPSGEYSFNLPPGDYYVLAVPEDQSADWQDAVFLEAASRVAVRVRIGEGERKTQDLRTRGLQ